MKKPHICKFCNRDFKQTRGHQIYCSMECYKLARHAEKKSIEHGGYINCNGYRMLHIEGQRILEHRYIMEQHIGRKLLASEVVHHIDHNRLNNAIDNLKLFKTNTEHIKNHYFGYRSETHKQCRGCLEIKPRSEFHAGKKGRINADPNSTRCKSCIALGDASRWKHGNTTYQKRYAQGLSRKHNGSWVSR